MIHHSLVEDSADHAVIMTGAFPLASEQLSALKCVEMCMIVVHRGRSLDAF